MEREGLRLWGRSGPALIRRLSPIGKPFGLSTPGGQPVPLLGGVPAAVSRGLALLLCEERLPRFRRNWTTGLPFLFVLVLLHLFYRLDALSLLRHAHSQSSSPRRSRRRASLCARRSRRTRSRSRRDQSQILNGSNSHKGIAITKKPTASTTSRESLIRPLSVSVPVDVRT